MMKNRFNGDELIDRYLNDRCTPEEKEVLERHHIQFLERKGDPLSATFVGQSKAKNYKILYARLKGGRALTYSIKLIRISAAAAVLFSFGIGIYFLQNIKGSPSRHIPSENSLAKDVPPGANKAMIIFSDGRKLLLDSTKQGITFRGKQITYQDGSPLTAGEVTSGNPFSNETILLTTPRGGQYQVELNDGTKVWLNAASTLKYSVRFKHHIRAVEIEGEAYFAVKPIIHANSNGKNKPINVLPFMVRSGMQVIQVLGTEFNVRAYPDECLMRTTLAEGRVQVSRPGGQPIILKPGQAAINGKKSQKLTVVQADLDSELAWKRGYFVFNNENIKDIMQRISRWYDIEVTYQGDMHDKKFGGIFQRSKSIAQLLDKLKQTGTIDFKISGRRVVVMEK